MLNSTNSNTYMLIDCFAIPTNKIGWFMHSISVQVAFKCYYMG